MIIVLKLKQNYSPVIIEWLYRNRVQNCMRYGTVSQRYTLIKGKVFLLRAVPRLVWGKMVLSSKWSCCWWAKQTQNIGRNGRTDSSVGMRSFIIIIIFSNVCYVAGWACSLSKFHFIAIENKGNCPTYSGHATCIRALNKKLMQVCILASIVL